MLPATLTRSLNEGLAGVACHVIDTHFEPSIRE
jgi:hypothetical protein